MNNRLDVVGETVGAVLTVTQTNEVFQIVSLILTVISIGLSIAFTIWKWYKKAKSDGKIDSDEIDELLDEIKDKIDENKDKE